MIKKYSKIFISILAFIPFLNVSAESQPFYVNSNNISMTEEQYNYLLNFYSEDIIFKMTQDRFDYEMQYDFVLDSASEKYIKTVTYYDDLGNAYIDENEISEEDYDKAIMPLANNCEVGGLPLGCWETTYKKLMLYSWVNGDIGNLTQRFDVQNEWKIMPAVRSFDVIGIRYYDYNPLYAFGYQNTYTNSGYEEIYYSYDGTNMNRQSNGIGISQNIVDDSSLYGLTNRLIVDGKNYGTEHMGVFASYQHATSDLTLDQSKNYSFGSGGLGDVFIFNNGISSFYDHTQGVSYVY